MPLPAVIGLFVLAAVVIAVAGTRLTRDADRLADATGWGEALVGAVLLGGITSLAGVVTTLTAAAEGHPQLAVGNAIGGIAVQTAFLAIADIFHRRGNLEHAAASLKNLMYSVLLLGLLVMLILGAATPEVTLLGAHPMSPLLFVAYVAGLRLVQHASREPMWKPRNTERTVEDEPDGEKVDTSRGKLAARIALWGSLVAVAGWGVAHTGVQIADRTGLSETFVGALLTAFVTSLPELVVSVTAVRAGALTLAVGNIVGGNSFEVLVVAGADFVYQRGSILHTASAGQELVIALTAVLMAVLLMGLLHRQREGIGGIGWESALILVLFLAGYGVLATL